MVFETISEKNPIIARRRRRPERSEGIRRLLRDARKDVVPHARKDLDPVIARRRSEASEAGRRRSCEATTRQRSCRPTAAAIRRRRPERSEGIQRLLRFARKDVVAHARKDLAPVIARRRSEASEAGRQAELRSNDEAAKLPSNHRGNSDEIASLRSQRRGGSRSQRLTPPVIARRRRRRGNRKDVVAHARKDAAHESGPVLA